MPGYIEDTLARIQAYAEVIHRGGAIALGVGGDHSVTLAELRAAAAVHGPLGLVHLDAHHDVWDSYFGRPYNHGTVFKRACEEGLLDPARCVQAGMRGSLYGPGDYEVSRALGMTILPWLELRELGPAAYGELVRERAGSGPVFFTFDVDFVDPAFCPGTGTPEVGGPTSAEALDYVRALHGLDFRGLDVVEVAPQYDGPGQVTALLAANVAYEMLSLIAAGAAPERGLALDRHETAREPPHAEGEGVADDQVGDVVLAEVDDGELLDQRVGHADRPQARLPAPDDERDERRPCAVQRRHRGHGVVVEEARHERGVGERLRALVAVLADALERADQP